MARRIVAAAARLNTPYRFHYQAGGARTRAATTSRVDSGTWPQRSDLPRDATGLAHLLPDHRASSSWAGRTPLVGLALHLRVVVSRSDVRGLARVTLSGFAATLVLALLMLIPGESSSSTGASLICLGAAVCLLTAPSLIFGERSGRRTIRIWLVLLRFGLIELGFLGIIASGALLAEGDFRSTLDQLIPVTIVLLVISLRNTWDVLVSVGHATLTSPSVGATQNGEPSQR